MVLRMGTYRRAGEGGGALARGAVRASGDARAAAGVTFFACAKKVTKETHPWRRALRAPRSGSAIGPGIFGRGLLPLPKTAHIPVRRPAGFTRPACHALTGTREAKAGAAVPAMASMNSPFVAFAFAPGPPSAAVAPVGKPEGRRARCAAFWAGTGMCLPKIPIGDTDPSRAAVGARRPGCAFFGYFLCTSKESDAPRRARHRRQTTSPTRASAHTTPTCA